MNDINPGFAPHNRVLRDLPVASKLTNHKGKEKAVKEGILSFFGKISLYVSLLLLMYVSRT